MVCRRPTRVLHEIVPKSIATFDWRVWTNRVTLCQECHEKVHTEGSQNWKDRLEARRNQRLLEYHNADLAKVLEDVSERQ